MNEKIDFLETVDDILVLFESIIKKINRLIKDSEETLEHLDNDFLWKFYRLDMWWGYLEVKRKLKALREKKEHYIHTMKRTKHNKKLLMEEKGIA